MKLLCNLFCKDIEAQLAFYQALLALPEAVHSRSPIYRALATENFQFGFHDQRAYDLLGLRSRAPQATSEQSVRTYPTFEVANSGEVDRLAAHAVSLGGRLVQGPYPSYYSQWQVVLADPENHIFRITALGLPAGVAAPELVL
jgi:catechol 2,3-dioxygenase-like lactoylglutathione lyase family enzyme